MEVKNIFQFQIATAITLKLPATWAEFHDALQKARIPDGRNCGIELTRSWWAGLSSDLIGGAKNLYELNLFARRLTMLTSVELLSMDGLLKMEQAQGTKSIPLPRLINLTFNADCHIVPDVFNDESLGAFLYENEMLTKEVECLLDTTEPGSGYRGRLLEVFGEEHRQAIGGVFTSCGYMEPSGEAFEEVYRPGQMAYFDRSGSPVVLEVTMGCFDDPAYDSDKSAFVPFPVSWTVKMKKKQKETQDILSYHSQAAGCSDKARAKASGGRQPIEECGRTGL